MASDRRNTQPAQVVQVPEITAAGTGDSNGMKGVAMAIAARADLGPSQRACTSEEPSCSGAAQFRGGVRRHRQAAAL